MRSNDGISSNLYIWHNNSTKTNKYITSDFYIVSTALNPITDFAFIADIFIWMNNVNYCNATGDRNVIADVNSGSTNDVNVLFYIYVIANG